METFLIQLSTEHAVWLYISIIIIAIMEGPILSIILGALIHLGYFPLVPVYLTLMGGDLLGDVIWYMLGRFLGFRFITRFGKYFSLTEERITLVERFYHTYHRSILIISKLTTGFGFAIPILFTAGLVKIPFRIYLIINTLGQVVWTALLVSIGYYFSELMLTFDDIFARLSIVSLLVVLIALFVGLSKYIKQKIIATSR
jgi:membrane protein DedA with SNARE-associated domain